MSRRTRCPFRCTTTSSSAVAGRRSVSSSARSCAAGISPAFPRSSARASFPVGGAPLLGGAGARLRHRREPGLVVLGSQRVGHSRPAGSSVRHRHAGVDGPHAAVGLGGSWRWLCVRDSRRRHNVLHRWNRRGRRSSCARARPLRAPGHPRSLRLRVVEIGTRRRGSPVTAPSGAPTTTTSSNNNHLPERSPSPTCCRVSSRPPPLSDDAVELRTSIDSKVISIPGGRSSASATTSVTGARRSTAWTRRASSGRGRSSCHAPRRP